MPSAGHTQGHASVLIGSRVLDRNEMWCRWVKFWNLKTHLHLLNREISRRHCESNALASSSVATLDETVRALVGRCPRRDRKTT
jgi:hypothetical protein